MYILIKYSVSVYRFLFLFYFGDIIYEGKSVKVVEHLMKF